MKPTLQAALRERRLVCDGAMGTQLMQAGLASGECGEWWNQIHPERVLGIQRSYADAGADCLITNTFGGSRLRLGGHGHAEDVLAINRAAARIAREAFGNRPGYVLGDMGPLGAILEPYGDLSQEDARAAYEEQARALVEGGVDAIIIETQTSVDEMGVAIAAAKAAGAPYIIASFAYDLSADQSFYVTSMGVAPEKAAAFVEEQGANMVGLNCGTGMDMIGAAKVAGQYRQACTLPTMAQPNAGLPVLVDGKPVYQQGPSEMAQGVTEALSAGVAIIGSCCGSTPDHTRAIRKVVEQFNRG